MVKLVPEANVHADDLAWRPWEEKRTAPFVASGASGEAWVKVLSRDPDSGAESLLYKLDKGWEAAGLENTVYENLLVLDGVLEADGQTLMKYCYSYRPEGHVTERVSSPTGATVIAYAGAEGELASKVPVPCVDADAMPWTRRPVADPDALYFIKMLRGDEENLDTFWLMRAVRGTETFHTSAHDAPEESYFLEGLTEFYDSVTEGRWVGTKGTYTHRAPMSVHGFVKVIEDHLIYKHDYFVAESDALAEQNLAAYPRESNAVRALREGRFDDLPKRW